MKVSSLHRVDAAAPADLEALSLPAWIYRDPEFFERERQAIFRNSWQVVCHLNDIPQAGRLSHLRVPRRVGVRGARRGRRGARLPQRLPPSRRAPARRAERPLRPAASPARTTPGPTRFDGRLVGVPNREAFNGPRHRAPRPRQPRARGLPRLRVRALRAGSAERAGDGRPVRCTSWRRTGWRSWCRMGRVSLRPRRGELEERRRQLLRRPAHPRGAPGPHAPVRPRLRHRGQAVDRQDVGHAARHALQQLVGAALPAASCRRSSICRPSGSACGPTSSSGRTSPSTSTRTRSTSCSSCRSRRPRP